MSKTLVIGSTGKIGRLLLPMLQSNGVNVAAMARNRSRLSDMDGIEIIEADLEQDFEDAFTDCDRVVFTAGSGATTGGDKTLLIDLWAARKAIDYAAKHHIKHFVMISARGADDPDSVNSPIKHYLIAKCVADAHLQRSGVPFTILRPGRLTDDQGTGCITTRRPDAAEQQTISRNDVARIVAHVLKSGQSKNVIHELYRGETPFADLIA